jgi:hypothetical protein
VRSGVGATGAPAVPTESREELLALKSGGQFVCTRPDGSIRPASVRSDNANEFRGPAFTGVLKKPAAWPGEPRLPGDSATRAPLSLDR